MPKFQGYLVGLLIVGALVVVPVRAIAQSAGLVASYSFDEGSGTSVFDSTGNGNTGTISGAQWDPLGRFGGALSFDGSNDFVTIPDAPSLDLTTGMTLEAWVRPTALGSWSTLILKEISGDLAYALYASTNGGLPAGWVTAGGSRSVTGPTALPLSTWSHLALSYDGSTLRLYVDATQVATRLVSGAMATSSRALQIGGNAIWGEFFSGLIDEVRIYNRALSSAEIAADMQVGGDSPPRLVIDQPAAGAVVVGSTLDIAYSTTGDQTEVSHVHFRVDGGPDLMDPPPLDGIYSIPGLAPGPHTLDGYLVRSDHSKIVGSDAQSVSLQVTVPDSTPPNVTLTAPGSGATIEGIVSLTANATDDIGVAGVQFLVNGSAVGAEDTDPPYSFAWNSGTVANGSYTLSARAGDLAGNTTDSTEVSVTVSNTAQAPGLVASYSFDEGSGTSVLDGSGNGNTGAVSGSQWEPAGRFGGALSFNGTNDLVTIPDAPSLDLTTGMTLEAWVQPTAVGGWSTVILKEMSGDLAYALYASTNGGLPSGWMTTGDSQSVTGSTGLPLSNWSHLALSYDGSTLRLYVDATEVATRPVSGAMATSSRALQIGGNAIWGEFFSGLIDEVRVYNRALSPAEIAADMQVGGDSTPRLVIDQPTTGAVIVGSTLDVAYSTTGDQTEVSHVHFRVDGGPDLMDPPPLDGVYSIPALTPGSHTLDGYLVGAGHGKIIGSDAPTVSFTIAAQDLAPPNVTLTTPLEGASVAGTVQLAANASDDVALESVQFLLDGAALGVADTLAPFTVDWDTSAALPGDHVLSARARDTSGNETTSVAVNVVVSPSGDPAVTGQWSTPIGLPTVAVNWILLHTGKVLFWAGEFQTAPNFGELWDPSTNVITPVPNPFSNIFCSAHVALADGRLLVAGGHDQQNSILGLPTSNIFDPVTETWTQLPDMAYRRWYPTLTMLGDGRAIVNSGSEFSEDVFVETPEIFDPTTNTWTELTTATAAFPQYPMMYLLPDGRLLETGSTEDPTDTRVLDFDTQTWSVVDPRVLEGGSGVMYRPGKIMKAGSPTLDGVNPLDPSLAITYVLDMNAATPTWRETQPMEFPRTFHNITMLPDGTALATGGSELRSERDLNPAVLEAELWSPSSETWTTLAPMEFERLYHGSAILLPDARVAVAGGGNLAGAVDMLSVEIFSPPYLFRGPRPNVTSVPAEIQYGSEFTVETPDASNVTSVSLVRPGAATHGFDQDQRFVPLSFSLDAGDLRIQAPVDGNLAPPGYYMLFLISQDGVPSVAEFVRLPAPYEDLQPPTAASNLTAQGAIGSASLTWDAASDNVGPIEYDVHRSSTSGFTPDPTNLVARTTATSYVDVGATIGLNHYSVVAVDAAGNVSPASNEAFADVLSDTIPPTVSILDLTEGAVLSGAVTLRADATDNVAVAGVQFQLDGAPLGAEDVQSPYSFPWSTHVVANGSYTLTTTARDTAGNQTTSSGITIEIANTTIPGLVASWSFEDGSGSTAVDGSGNGHDALIGGATWTANGRYGNALSFDGINDIATVADTDALDLQTGMTLEAWVAPDAVGGWRTILMKEATSDLSYSIYAAGQSPNPVVYVTGTGGTSSLGGVAPLALGIWTHLAISYDGQTLRYYENAIEIASQPYNGGLLPSAGPLQLGGNAIWGEYFQGRIDEVRVYDRMLEANEILADMQSGGAAAGPRLQITGPTENAMIAGTNVDVTYSVSGDLSEASHAHFRLDGGVVIVDPPPIDGVLQLSNVLPGAHTLDAYLVRSDDSPIGGSDANTLSFTTAVPDTEPPVIVLINPRDGDTLAGLVTVTVTASDNVGVASVEFTLDGTPIAPAVTAPPFVLDWNTAGVSNGTYVMEATARDTAGNASISIPITVTLANPNVIPGLVVALGFDESGGATALDASGNANDGVIVGAARVPDGRFGSALSFDGVDDLVTVADADSLDLTSGMTLGAWIQPTRLGDWHTVILKERPGDLAYALYASDNEGRPAGYIASGGMQAVNGTAGLALGSWTYVAVTYDGSALSLYENGVEIASSDTTAAPITTSDGTLQIGGNAIWGEFFEGLIDEVRVYDRALTPNEIQADMDKPVTPPVQAQPTRSSPIVVDALARRVWVVNPDNDSVAAFDADTLQLELELPLPVRAKPVSVGVDAFGRAWVACEGDDSLRILDGTTGQVAGTLSLPRGSAPVAITFEPDGTRGYVSAHGTGGVHRVDPNSDSVDAFVTVGRAPRALAVTGDGQRLLVTQLLSEDSGGRVHTIDLASFTPGATIDLPVDTTSPDSAIAARGLPNYLVGLAIDPMNDSAWVVAKKDNILRGSFRDGQALTFETSVRAMVGVLDLATNTELIANRLDIDDHAQPSAVALSASGEHVFVAMQGNNDLIVLNPLGGEITRVATGLAPQGVAIDPVTRRVFTKNLMSRDVSVFDGLSLIEFGDSTLPALATIATITTETMAPDVLRGKQIFYDAADPRMGADGYISCALCHLDGGHDGRVWDFTDRGEGLRNTISLRGQAGDSGAPLHWSGNFDEVQDFENDIRNAFGGAGFMSDTEFLAGTRADPLGDPKAGVNADLDALASYVNSLSESGNSPFRLLDGSFTPDALAGEAIFSSLGCDSCHSGPRFSDSASGLRHDVGTIKPSSGNRIGGPFDGVDTPTLIGLWDTAPYLHDGSAATLQDVLISQNPAGDHGDVSGLSAIELDQLVQYLLQLELDTP